jgi:hypothetical protein
MVCYGILTGNVPIQTEACRWYAKALHSLHSFLQTRTFTSDTNTSLSTEDIVCAPIMMCHFEMMAGTSPVAWMQHVDAAATMLVSRGPKNCRLGLEHRMFLTVRLFMVSSLYCYCSSAPAPSSHFFETSKLLIWLFGDSCLCL